MSLRDRLRSLRPGGSEDEQEIVPDGEAPPDPIDFRPRFDGSYRHAGGGPDGANGEEHGAAVVGPRIDLTLRFSHGSVTETADGPGATEDGAAVGEYTSSGRFVVQRRFGRPIVYTILEIADEGFTARRTDTNPGGTATEPTFRFEPTVEGTAT